ncbi:MAG: stage III sporulation AC/AD family protein, partial [Oscillospiraceae bacterium]
MNIFMIAGISLIACAIIILLKEQKPEFAILVSICAGILIFLYAINHLNPAITVLKNLMKKATINQEYVTAILKTLSVCYVTQ